MRATVMTTVVKTRPQYHSIFYTASSCESADFVENFVENFSTIVENFVENSAATTVVFVENSS